MTLPLEHVYYTQPDLDGSDGKKAYRAGRPQPTGANRANLVSSRLIHSTNHAPVLDLDFPARLIPSSSPGHFHLFLHKPISWADYIRLLDLMVELGLLEANWVAQAKKDGMTLVRKPGIFKPQAESGQQLRQRNTVLEDEVRRLQIELADAKAELSRANLTNWA